MHFFKVTLESKSTPTTHKKPQKMKSAFLFILSVFCLSVKSSPRPQSSVLLNSEQTDEDRFVYLECLKEKCDNKCAQTGWKLFRSKGCDTCARKKCQEFTYKNEKYLHGYGYTAWLAFNDFVDRLGGLSMPVDDSGLGIE